MGMYVYKMFEPGLICRGYQFKVGVNECDHATCVKEGFHAAENPLDCLSYYGNFDKSECWYCYADGDIHEDGRDSKISCTRLEILCRLSKADFVAAAMMYMINHRKRPLSCNNVKHDRGIVDYNGLVIVLGNDPIAMGKKKGDILGYIKTDDEWNEKSAAVFVVDDERIMSNKWYDSKGKLIE